MRKKSPFSLVEQNARKALKAASRAYILELGKIVIEGGSVELSMDPRVQAAYLGGAGMSSATKLVEMKHEG